MGLFSKFKKKVKKNSIEREVNEYFRLKDATYNTPPKPNFSQDSADSQSDVSDYLNQQYSSSKLTTRDLFAKDALDNVAYTKLVQALLKELGCGEIKPNGYSNFEWNTLAHYVMTTVIIHEYYGKTVSVTLGINCRTNNTSNAFTIKVGDDKANIPLDPIPDNDKDASFIYENTAKKTKEFLVSKRYNSLTF